jgi:hypothetical protein
MPSAIGRTADWSLRRLVNRTFFADVLRLLMNRSKTSNATDTIELNYKRQCESKLDLELGRIGIYGKREQSLNG